MIGSDFLGVAIEAAKKAEKILLKYYSSKIDFFLKGDGTPVTKADKEANEIIIETIKKKFPMHGFLTEEMGDQIKNSEHIWIVDPLDATKNFIRGLPFFSTEIALMKAGELIIGVSNAPAVHEFAYAEKGKGAYMDSQRLKVSKRVELSDAFIGHGTVDNFSRIGLLSGFVELASQAYSSRCFGDAWMYHQLAAGKIDIVVEAGLSIWDVAALAVIVREAGGTVTDIYGKELTLKTKTLLATNKKLHPLVLSLFK